VVAIQDTASTTIHPIGETAALGIWSITVAEVVSGEEAASLMAQTNEANPAAPEGQAWLCARIVVENTSDRPRPIQMVDFAVTGGDGILRRTSAVVPPDPILQAVVEPGGSTEGWIAATVSDPASAMLWFDSPFLGGTWSDGLFALADGVSAPTIEQLDTSDSDAGSDPSTPAAIGDTVRVGGWEITIDDVVMGGDIFELFDFQTKALGADDGWIQNGAAIHAVVRNLNPFPAFFSEITFEIADFDGEPWDHTLTLTIPTATDVAREYLPGATGEGWTAFGGQPWTEYNLIRVAPFKVGGGVRYITFGGTPPPAGAEEAETPATDATAEAEVEPKPFVSGDTVVTSEDLVNLRADPSANGEILQEMPLGTELQVTGEATTADGYTWFPVIVVETSEEGYVVQDFLEPKED